MDMDFKTRIIIYSIILGAMFLFAIYLAFRYNPTGGSKVKHLKK